MMIKRQIGARPFFTTGHVDQPAVPEKLVHHTVITTVRSIKRRGYLLFTSLRNVAHHFASFGIIATNNAFGNHIAQMVQVPRTRVIAAHRPSFIYAADLWTDLRTDSKAVEPQ